MLIRIRVILAMSVRVNAVISETTVKGKSLVGIQIFGVPVALGGVKICHVDSISGHKAYVSYSQVSVSLFFFNFSIFTDLPKIY